MSAMLGLQTSGMAQVVDALQKKPRKPVLWYHFQECTCCSESFIRASHPLVSQILFDMISLEYTDTLMAAAGEQAEALREKAIKENFGNYIMIVEGAIPLGSPGYCTIAGRDAREIFEDGAAGARSDYSMGQLRIIGLHTTCLPKPDRCSTRTQSIFGKTDHQCTRLPAHRRRHGRNHYIHHDVRPPAGTRQRRSPQSVLRKTCTRHLLPRPAYDAGYSCNRSMTRTPAKVIASITWVAKVPIRSTLAP